MRANLLTPDVGISSIQAVLDKAAERYRRECFLRAANDDYLALRKNSKQWKAALAERRIWDRTLSDGLGL